MPQDGVISSVLWMLSESINLVGNFLSVHLNEEVLTLERERKAKNHQLGKKKNSQYNAICRFDTKREFTLDINTNDKCDLMVI